MNIVTLDFETYFDKDYSLTKLSTEEYVRDPRFEIHGCAIRWPSGELEWRRDLYRVEGATIERSALLCHHTHFDGLVLAHHYGVRPAAYLDTLSMARLLLGNHVGHSLDAVRQQLGLPVKRTPYHLFKGKHWAELTVDVQREIAAGALDEVCSIWLIFNRFMVGAY